MQRTILECVVVDIVLYCVFILSAISPYTTGPKVWYNTAVGVMVLDLDTVPSPSKRPIKPKLGDIRSFVIFIKINYFWICVQAIFEYFTDRMNQTSVM